MGYPIRADPRGPLHVATPFYDHQHVIARLTMKVGPAVLAVGGDVVPEPGIVWDDEGEDNVSLDLAILLEVPRPPRGEELRRCPDIVIEVLSGGADSRRRDLDAKRDLYWRRGAEEYWIVDPDRGEAQRLMRGPNGWIGARLAAHDLLAIPLLPNWAGVRVADLLD
ncbi:MAG TPA: Uma2 family endonuclease [Candidatus Methylomirabilis sp.]|nr:Uma2 family endonuclease [Candidatus Methylomirabilis sp.]